ncbi:hypothetical protein [Lysinibacillus sp. BW-2-10]|uniref:hypothetical protein n=1 Tax=Lysinibacillus sp. BW-2-10 TaxID=2590030 RepID=UPI00117FAA63|nr:hypothetical protein [Lysinibacillus sp. BW-2-10]TSI02552.1 hypothetical protein FJQ64_18325 [Lysinibacillus sp. BW-2-10]
MDVIFTVLSFVGVIIYFQIKDSKALANLNIMQRIGVLMSFLITTIIIECCIYYGTSFLTEHIQNGFLIWIIRVTVVIITLWLAVFILNYILQKITNGIFPKIT